MITRAFFLLVVVLGAFDLPINSILVKSAGIQQRNNNNNNNITITNNPIGCNACRMHEEIRALSLKAIKEQILNKLGLKQAPNMTGRSLPRIPPLSKLMDMYGMQADQPQSSHELGITHHDETDEFSAKTESVFVLAQPHKKLRHSKSSLDVLYFKFSDKIIQHRVMRAELSVWILGTKVSETIKGNESFTEKFDKSDEIVSTSFFIPRNTENTDIINNYHGQNDKNIETRNNENKEITEDGEVVVVGDGDTHSDGDSEGDSEDGGGEGGDDDDDNDDDDDDEDDDDDNDDSDSATNNPSNKKNDKNRGRIIITLQRILRGTDENGGPLLGSPLTTRHKRPIGTHGTWITIELRRMVAEWFKHPRDNLGVAIKINNENNNINNNNNNDNNKNNNNNSNNNNKNSKRKKSNNYNNLPIIEINPNADHAPYLEVQTQELDNKRGTRIKRNVGLNCDESSQETRCCRYKLTVDFEKFGWDWIIAPKKYDANYCSGDCPMAFLPAYPNTHIVSLAEPPNNTGPCCAPRKLSEITMLYFDNEYQIVFSRLPGMVVERCGCS